MGLLFFRKDDFSRDAEHSRFIADLLNKERALQAKADSLFAQPGQKEKLEAESKSVQELREAFAEKQLRPHEVELKKWQDLTGSKVKHAAQHVSLVRGYTQEIREGKFRYGVKQKIIDRQRQRMAERAAENFAKQLIDIARGPNKRKSLARLLMANRHWFEMKNASNNLPNYNQKAAKSAQYIAITHQIFQARLNKAIEDMPWKYASRIDKTFASFGFEENFFALGELSYQELAPIQFGVSTTNPDDRNTTAYNNKTGQVNRSVVGFANSLKAIFTKRAHKFRLNYKSYRENYAGAPVYMGELSLSDDVKTLVDELLQVKNFQQALKLLAPYAEMYHDDRSFFTNFQSAVARVPNHSFFKRSKADIFEAFNRVTKEAVFCEEKTKELFLEIFDGLSNHLKVGAQASLAKRTVLIGLLAESNKVVEEKFAETRQMLEQSKKYKRIKREIKAVVQVDQLFDMVEGDCLSRVQGEIDIFLKSRDWTVLIKKFDELREIEKKHEKDHPNYELSESAPIYQYSVRLKAKIKEKLPAALLKTLAEKSTHEGVDGVPRNLWEAYQIACETWGADAAYDVTNDLYDQTECLVSSWEEQQLREFCQNLSAQKVLDTIGKQEWVTRKVSHRQAVRGLDRSEYSAEQMSRYVNAVISMYTAVINGAIAKYNHRFPDSALDIPEIPQITTPAGSPARSPEIEKMRAGSLSSTRSRGSLRSAGGSGRRRGTADAEEAADPEEVASGDHQLRRQLFSSAST